jgi:transcriptional regulator with GAF, ATPase, and Fis domain
VEQDAFTGALKSKVGRFELANGGTITELKRAHILKVLDFTHWRVSGPNGAAQILGINPQTLSID